MEAPSPAPPRCHGRGESQALRERGEHLIGCVSREQASVGKAVEVRHQCHGLV